MFDPTHFENLKVAFENHLYDLDNLDGRITIVHRSDRTDYAVLSRELSVFFQLAGQPDVTAEVMLAASLEDLAGEILEFSSAVHGCSLILRFYKRVVDPSIQCPQIEQALGRIWEADVHVKQKLSFVYGEEAEGYMNKIELQFKTKISEDNMGEIAPFLEHVLHTLDVLIDI
ncbi:hypothetical protein ACFSCZ_17190 [Siminovitchia sediminis]|uniref:Uncharacterized protein n=1 Tax=Siminovitchia sediminis TaxID=1274353 RepID=A0ABW4KL11_9BACI